MRRFRASLAVTGLFSGLTAALAPAYAIDDVDDFFQELINSPTQYSSSSTDRSRTNFTVPVRRSAGHSDSVRSKALPPESYVELSQKDLKPAEQMGTFAAAVHANLNDPDGAPVRVRKTHRRKIIEFYKDRNFEPVWAGDYGLSAKAKHLLALLSKADEEGLSAKDYLPASLSDYLDQAEGIENSPSILAKLEIELTAAALEYSHHVSAGRVKPIRISELHSIKAKPVDPAEVLSNIASTLRPDTYLASLQPLTPQYKFLKNALAKYRKSSGADEAIYIPAGRLIKAGRYDDRIELIAKRLQQLGFYDIPPQPGVEAGSGSETAATASPDSSLYSQDLVAAIKDMQEQSGLKRDGVIGNKTISALNGKSDAEKITKIVLSMERLRWLPQDLKSKYIFVNQAFFETWVMDGGKEIFRSDVIVGKPQFQTAVFADEMEKVVLNPSWYVPRSIIYNEMIPKLFNNPYYLEDEGYEVTDTSGRVVDSASVDWGRYTKKSIPFGVRQPPGPGNALGKVKFLFPNKHAIYMHDTPARSLFKKSVRAFSHGCVRVQKPMEFAEIILGTQGWSPERIRAEIATGQNQTIFLKQKIPVYLGYYTAWADAQGNVQTRDDIYGRDRVLNQALEQNDRARSSQKIAMR